MRSVGGRAKKLTVAFHFQFANQAGWKCDTCRRQGLETQRNCGWLGKAANTRRTRPVWMRKSAIAHSCPVSFITPESLAWVEQYTAWKLMGGLAANDLPAKTVEAFCLLENELRNEVRNAER